MSADRYHNYGGVPPEGPRPVEGDEARLKALRDAAAIGIADIEAGRYSTFGSPRKLKSCLRALRDEALSRKRLSRG